MTIGDVISKYRKEHGLSMDKFAKLSGLSKAYISILEKNKTPRGAEPTPSIEIFRSVAGAIGMDTDELIRMVDGKIRLLPQQKSASLMGHIDTGKTKALQFPKHDEADDIANRYRNLDDHGKGAVRAILDFEEASAIADKHQRKPVKPRSDGFVDVKVFDQVSAAGLGNYLDDPVYHMEQYPANEVPDGTEFGVRISGVSMSPKIPDGATAFVQSRSAIEPGKIGIFLVNGESFCKKLVVDRDRQEIRLASFNSDYKDRVIEDADVFSTMGLVLGWWPHG